MGLGTAADFMGRDVRGKAVLILSILEPGQMGLSANWEGAWKRAADIGAAAIFTVWGYDNLVVWQGMTGGITVPGFFMGYEDGKALRDLIETGHHAPSVQVIDSPDIKHTDADIAERVPDVGLASVARAYAKIIDEVNRLDPKDLQSSELSKARVN